MTAPMSVDGKVALITGAAQGLGKGFAQILLENGAKVALTDKNKAEGEKTAEEFKKKFVGRVIFFKLDVTSEKEMKEVFKKTQDHFKGLDIVVNNAGIGETADWELCVDINLKGPIRGTRLALDALRKDKGGHGGVIINIASAAALQPQPSGQVYSGTKAGVVMFSRSVAADPTNQTNGVRINTMCPSFVDTPLVHNLRNSAPAGSPVHKKLDSVGVMSVEEVSSAFFSLVTNSLANGQVIFLTKGVPPTPIDFNKQ